MPSGLLPFLHGDIIILFLLWIDVLVQWATTFFKGLNHQRLDLNLSIGVLLAAMLLQPEFLLLDDSWCWSRRCY